MGRLREHHASSSPRRRSPASAGPNFRASSPEALQRRVAAIEATGLGMGWQDGDPGYGPVYVFTDPDGHEMGVYYETEWYRPDGRPEAGAEEPGPGLSRPRASASGGSTTSTTSASNPVANRDFFVDTLGAMVTEQIVLDAARSPAAGPRSPTRATTWSGPRTGPARPAGCTTSRSPSTPATTSSAPPTSPSSTASTSRPGRTSTPSSRRFFLYVYEPGGNRIELDNPAARLVLAPDWQPVDWSEAERAKGQAWGLKTIDTLPHPRHAAGPGGAVTLRIAVLGLGEAGSEIARDLVAAGADVRGYDPLAHRRRRGRSRAAARPTRWPTPTWCSASTARTTR